MKSKTRLTIAYIAAIHVFLVVVFWKPGFYHRINPFAKERTETYEILYNNMLALHLRIDGHIQGEPVIFIGDSIIQGMCVSCITANSINFGIGLDTTEGVLRRIQRYTSLKHAKAVVLAVGLNDTRVRPNQDILVNYRRILAAIPKETPILFSAVLPIAYHPRWPNDTNDRIKALNIEAEKLCISRPGCTFADFSPDIANSQGALDARFHIGDGIHPNTEGYQRLISAYKFALIQKRRLDPVYTH